ncbi:MAG TPA: hypothetical protein VM253_04860 [Candidatus Limnocylindrales bacterium]|nr:hypothetical protein [Candidatus Limnocylindrales bacterium]
MPLGVLRGLFAVAASMAMLLAACGADDPSPAARADCPAEASVTSPPAANEDPVLADRMPDEVAGRRLEIQTVCATVAGAGGLTTAPEFLQAVGVELRDVTIARDRGAQSGSPETYASVTAWRYGGAAEDDIRAALLDAFDRAGIPVEEDTVGGKEVHRALLHVYYVADDTLYAVVGQDAGVEALVEALP